MNNDDVMIDALSTDEESGETSILDLSSLGDFENKADKSGISSESESNSPDRVLLGSAVSANEDKDEDPQTKYDKSSHGETLYDNTASMLESRSISAENGIKLLRKSADEGCASALIYLGRIYGDRKSALYDPDLSFKCFSEAAERGFEEGYYYLGVCRLHGIGCESDPAAAVELLLRGGELGHIPSISTLGICREKGVGCEIDYPMAVKLYERAAECDDPIAINNLGGCYFYGHGVVKDKERAVSLYTRASELGNSNATCRLGICLEDGDGCERDAAAAFECYKKAAESGNPLGAYRLALCYDRGIGVEQNFAKAFSCYNRSATGGYAPAMYEAGMMRKEGRGTKKNAIGAYKLFSQAAEKGLSDAKYELGNCYIEGKGTVKNAGLAYLCYLEAFESDGTNAKAAFRLGLCNLKGIGTQKDDGVALEWFCRGAELGSSSAAYMKGECYFYGVGVEKDSQKAVESYKDALSDKMTGEISTDAYLSLAECEENGIGTEVDAEEAALLYKNAADSDNAEAMYNLGRLMLSGVNLSSIGSGARTVILRAARSEYPPAMLAMGIFADEGRGVAKNAQDAERWYTKTIGAQSRSLPDLDEFPQRFFDRAERASSARVEAQYRLGMLLTKKEPSVRSYISAFENIAFAASLGHAGAQKEISGIYLHGGDLKSYYESALAERKDDAAVSKAVAVAMNKLGDAYFDGKTLVKKNEAAAARCYKIAAEAGDVDGAYSYGWCLRHGAGLNENDALAVKWLKIAADRGSINAAYSYGLCCEEGSGTGIKNKREARSYYRKAAAAGHLEAARRYMALSDK